MTLTRILLLLPLLAQLLFWPNVRIAVERTFLQVRANV